MLSKLKVFKYIWYYKTPVSFKNSGQGDGSGIKCLMSEVSATRVPCVEAAMEGEN